VPGPPLYQVDAFTDEPFRGNPAGVCLLETERSPEWMQAVAAEMNLSETAFLQTGGAENPIRYFTPEAEVPLCGHATLASAHIVWEAGLVSPEREIRFVARAGLLGAAREGSWIRLDFPADRVVERKPPPGLVEASGVRPRAVFTGRLGFWLLELDSESDVRAAAPDFTALRRGGFEGFMITARSEAREADFVSRFFAPGVGIDEDPVTGAAHCALGPFWSEKLGKRELTGRQLSRRGGVVRVRMAGERVHLLGQALTVFRAELLR
jgi:predicted PhzF superfamily epimerase YddE/YHI9